jgi:hypothetical protein
MGKQLVTLLGPFTLAYLALLLPRGTLGLVFDRYLLPLEFVTILALLRTMQKHMPGRLILFSGVPLLLYSTAGVATTHDKFALYRAQLTAINELRAAGVPPTAIDGGFAYNGWSELQISSHVNDARLPGATTATVLASYTAAARCQPEQGYLFPDLHARYLLTDSPRACGGRAPFTPVIYTVWTWWPHSETLYIVYGLSGPVQ